MSKVLKHFLGKCEPLFPNIDGLVMGKYSYVDANGIQRSLSYKAGADIGFVPNLSNFSGKEGKNMR